MQRLVGAFRQVDRKYLVILAERIVDKKMTKEQIHDAVSKVIDTCIYPVPGMAEILSHDRTVKLYTHKQITNVMLPQGYEFSDFEMIELDGQRKWIEK